MNSFFYSPYSIILFGWGRANLCSRFGTPYSVVQTSGRCVLASILEQDNNKTL